MTQISGLVVDNIFVSIDQKKVLTNLTLMAQLGSTHVIMGPNGSGKSTLALSITGSPMYELTQGSVSFLGVDITALLVHERARQGIFLSFQQPPAIPGLQVQVFLQAMISALGYTYSVSEFRLKMDQALSLVGLSGQFLTRNVNEGFSGGERKRFELLQALLFRPRLLILDEIDSGLDIDALRCVKAVLMALRSERPEMILLCITHYARILEYIDCDVIHILKEGTIVHSGGFEVAQMVDRDGYVQWQ